MTMRPLWILILHQNGELWIPKSMQPTFSKPFLRCKEKYKIMSRSIESISQRLLFFSHSVASDSLWPHGLQYVRLPVLHYLPEFAQTHVYWVGDAIQPSCPLLLLPSVFLSIRVFSNESALCIRWLKYWSFSISMSPSHEYSGLFPLQLTGLISLQSQGLSRVFSSTIRKYQFLHSAFTVQLSHSYMNWKNQSFDYKDLCRQSDVSAF